MYTSITVAAEIFYLKNYILQSLAVLEKLQIELIEVLYKSSKTWSEGMQFSSGVENATTRWYLITVV